MQQLQKEWDEQQRQHQQRDWEEQQRLQDKQERDRQSTGSTGTVTMRRQRSILTSFSVRIIMYTFLSNYNGTRHQDK